MNRLLSTNALLKHIPSSNKFSRHVAGDFYLLRLSHPPTPHISHFPLHHEHTPDSSPRDCFLSLTLRNSTCYLILTPCI